MSVISQEIEQVFQGRQIVYGEGCCYGSFGELLQGVLPDDHKFLMHLKIKNSSNVKIKIYKEIKQKNEQIFTSPPQKMDPPDKNTFENNKGNMWKSQRVIKNILQNMELDYNFNLDISSDLPYGKGLSSSTADMVASIRALENALNISLESEIVSKYISSVEPNDGLHIKGSVAYNYISGEVLFQSKYVPTLRIIGIDTGGIVDTVEFNRRVFNFRSREKKQYRDLLNQLKIAMDNKDILSICSISTQSAILWQNVFPKPDFKKILKISQSFNSPGLINCHSGTYLGIAFDANQDISSLLEEMKCIFPKYSVHIYETLP
jgi:L-threonine kinase